MDTLSQSLFHHLTFGHFIAKGFRLAGDVDFDNVAPLCSYITPVPGGVGPMTITMLMLNTLEASRRELYITYHD